VSFLRSSSNHISGDLSALSPSVPQTVPPRLHLSNASLKSGGEGLVGEGGTNDGRENFMQFGQPLDRIGEASVVDLGVLCPNALADRAIGGGSK